MAVKDIIYFDEPGPANSEELLELAIKRIDELGIKNVVIAATDESIARKAVLKQAAEIQREAKFPYDFIRAAGQFDKSKIDYGDAEILTDDKAPSNWLKRLDMKA